MKVEIYLIDTFTVRNIKYPIIATTTMGSISMDPSSIVNAIATITAVIKMLLTVNHFTGGTSGI